MLGNCQQIDLRRVFRNSVACSVKETAGAAPANAKRRKVAMCSDSWQIYMMFPKPQNSKLDPQSHFPVLQVHIDEMDTQPIDPEAFSLHYIVNSKNFQRPFKLLPVVLRRAPTSMVSQTWKMIPLSLMSLPVMTSHLWKLARRSPREPSRSDTLFWWFQTLKICSTVFF